MVNELTTNEEKKQQQAKQETPTSAAKKNSGEGLKKLLTSLPDWAVSQSPADSDKKANALAEEQIQATAFSDDDSDG